MMRVGHTAEERGLDGPRRVRALDAALVTVALLWAGMLAGVSFLATPAKFAAPSLTLPVALDVGRQTFGIFNLVEIGATALALTLATLAGRRAILALVAVAGAVVALQAAWLLPSLDARVAVILAGGAPPASSLHALYVALDLAKLLALLATGGLLLWSRAARAAAGHDERAATGLGPAG